MLGNRTSELVSFYVCRGSARLTDRKSKYNEVVIIYCIVIGLRVRQKVII